MTRLADLTTTLIGIDAANQLPAPSVRSYYDVREARRALVKSIESDRTADLRRRDTFQPGTLERSPCEAGR